MSEEQLTKEAMQKLLNDAKEVTTLFAVWTNNLDSFKNTNDPFAAVPYYFKWVDVAMVAAEAVDPTNQVAYKKIASELITSIVVPLKGMIDAMGTLAKQKNQELPAPTAAAPTDVFAYKTWAVEYISSVLKWMKDTTKA